MSLPRSKSTPLVYTPTTASIHDTPVRRHRPELLRARSVIAPTASSYWSSVYSLRAEKVENPFHLSDFFPARLGTDAQDWDWLREQAEDRDLDDPPTAAGNFITEEQRTRYSPSRQDGGRGVGDVINSEDKLGILSFSAPRFLTTSSSCVTHLRKLSDNLFASSEDDTRVVDDQMFSAYAEGDLTDDEALYSSICALRAAHNLPYAPLPLAKPAKVGGLFFVRDRADDEYRESAAGGWEVSMLLRRGMCLLMDLVDLQL